MDAPVFPPKPQIKTLPVHGISPSAAVPVSQNNYRYYVKLRPRQRIRSKELQLEVLEFLGSGGNGSVFRMLITEGTLAGVIVAAKFLEMINDADRVRRFEEEIGALQSVEHPNIVKILDTGKYELNNGARSIPFFVMEYQPRNLERETSAHPRGIHPDVLLPICLQMASAIVHIHSKGIVHRDLKPANILYDGNNVKLADFGIASLLDQSGRGKSVPGKKVGPHFYLSPEQWKWWKQESDAAAPGKESDVFQMGLIFQKMLSGFNVKTVQDWERADRSSEPREEPKTRMRTADGSLVNDLSSLVKWMIEVNPAQRPTAEKVRERLLDIFRSYSSHFSSIYGVMPGREF